MTIKEQRKNTIVKKYFTKEREKKIELSRQEQEAILNKIKCVALTYSNEIKDAYTSGVREVAIRFTIPFCKHIYHLEKIHFLCIGNHTIKQLYADPDSKEGELARRCFHETIDEIKARYKKGNDKRYKDFLFYIAREQFRRVLQDIFNISISDCVNSFNSEYCSVDDDLIHINFLIRFDDIGIYRNIDVEYENDNRLSKQDRLHLASNMVEGLLDLRKLNKDIFSSIKCSIIETEERKIPKQKIVDNTKETPLQICGWYICIFVLLLLCYCVALRY